MEDCLQVISTILKMSFSSVEKLHFINILFSSFLFNDWLKAYRGYIWILDRNVQVTHDHETNDYLSPHIDNKLPEISIFKK